MKNAILEINKNFDFLIYLSNDLKIPIFLNKKIENFLKIIKSNHFYSNCTKYLKSLYF